MSLYSLHRLGRTLAADPSFLDPTDTSNHLAGLAGQPAIESVTSTEIEQLLNDALLSALQRPHFGRALAAIAWVAVGHDGIGASDELLARVGLVYGRTLIRAELPSLALPILSSARARWEALAQPVQVAVCDWQIGMVCQQQTHFAQAAAAIRDAASRLADLGQKLDAARAWRDLAITLNLQGRADLAGAPLEEAIRTFQAADDDLELARCRVAEAARLQWHSLYSKALDELDQAIPSLRIADLPVELGIAHYVRAFLLMRRDTLAEAVSSLHEALRLFQEVHLPRRIARCDNVLGGAYLRSLRPLEAIPHLESAAAWFSEHEMSLEATWSRTNLGIAGQLLGDYAAARCLFLQAIPELEAAGALESVCNTRNHLGVLLMAEGRLEDALAVLEASWHLGEQTRLLQEAANSARHIALTCLRLGRSDQANDWLHKALEGFQQIGSFIQVVRTQLEFCQLMTDAGELEQAQQLACSARGACLESPADLARCELMLGRVALARKDWIAAEPHLAAGVTLFSRMGMLVSALEASVSWALATRHLPGRVSEAQAVLLSTQEQAIQQNLPDLVWQASLAQADIERDRGDRHAELTCLEAAGHWLAVARRRLAQPALEHAYLARRLGPLQRGLNLAIELDRPESALFFSDEMRSQSLTVQLHRLPTAPAIADEYMAGLAAERRQLLSELAMLEQELQRQSFSQDGLVSEEQSSLLNRHHELAGRHELTSQQLERAGRRQQLELPDIAPLAPARIKPAQWNSLTYHWASNRLIVFASTPASTEVIDRQLTDLDRMAIKMCTGRQHRAAVFEQPGHPLANPRLGRLWRQHLYNLLIPPSIQNDLRPDEPLIIIPHGPLYSLPFQTLLAPNGEMLVHQTAISYGPSLSMLDALQNMAVPAGRDKPQQDELLVAVSNFGGRHPPLGFVDAEVRALATSWPESAATLVNKEATIAALRSLPGQYRLLHFATHGFADPNYGRLAGIALADGDLLVDDLATLGIAAPLVVLSACETGLGIGQTDSESRGVAGVFFALGARHVVATMWQVEDSKTAALMLAFYRELGRGASPAVALARAQRKRSSLPLYQWASVACFGLP